MCGAVARGRKTILVEDVNAFADHIACDSASASEIVVPVLDADGELIAVLDVDSSIPAAFDSVDQRHLEGAVALLRPLSPEPLVSVG